MSSLLWILSSIWMGYTLIQGLEKDRKENKPGALSSMNGLELLILIGAVIFAPFIFLVVGMASAYTHIVERVQKGISCSEES